MSSEFIGPLREVLLLMDIMVPLGESDAAPSDSSPLSHSSLFCSDFAYPTPLRLWLLVGGSLVGLPWRLLTLTILGL